MRYEERDIVGVLILDVVEDSLGEEDQLKQCVCQFSRLNPCCCGR